MAGINKAIRRGHGPGKRPSPTAPFLPGAVCRAGGTRTICREETWLCIHEVRHTYRPGQPVLPWLYAIARNIRVDHYRKTQRRKSANRVWGRVRTFPHRGRALGPDLASLLLLYRRASEVIAMLKVSGMSSKR
jgi:hypothetical protein